jgi:hypothetical protein
MSLIIGLCAGDVKGKSECYIVYLQLFTIYPSSRGEAEESASAVAFVCLTVVILIALRRQPDAVEGSATTPVATGANPAC